MKIDYKKELKALYKPGVKRVDFVKMPSMNYLKINGEGAPESESYKRAIEALYVLSYTIKFKVKEFEKLDYGVMPLEGLWWVDDMTQFSVDKKEAWKWEMMIMQPEIVTIDRVQECIEIVKNKKNPPSLPKLRFEAFDEGDVAQIMHVGPFTEEGPTVDKVHKAIEEKGAVLSGKHHEIYLTDIRRAAPERWKTIIRQPYQY